MTSKLANFSKPETGLEHLAPEVKTLARPLSGPLLAARRVLKTSHTIKSAFKEARKSGDFSALGEKIWPELRDKLEATPEEALQAALYLVDEYEQLGDAMLLVSPVSGKAIARVTDADIWQPKSVPRESGTLAKPLPRLRPDLESFLVQWAHDEDREARVVQQSLEGLKQTSLQKAEGDTRLQPLTRDGRAKLAQSLHEALPTLLGTVQGTGRLFLEKFPVVTEPPRFGRATALNTCSGFSRVSSRIPDLKTINLKHDKFVSTGAQIGNGWVRDMAFTLAQAALRNAAIKGWQKWPEHVSDFEFSHRGVTLWIGPPDFAKALAGVSPVPCLPVEGVTPTGLMGPAGCLILDNSTYDSRSREVFDRWEVAATVDYTLYVDWSKVVSYEFRGVPTEVALAEVVA
jgi:hypothetical protein